MAAPKRKKIKYSGNAPGLDWGDWNPVSWFTKDKEDEFYVDEDGDVVPDYQGILQDDRYTKSSRKDLYEQRKARLDEEGSWGKFWDWSVQNDDDDERDFFDEHGDRIYTDILSGIEKDTDSKGDKNKKESEKFGELQLEQLEKYLDSRDDIDSKYKDLLSEQNRSQKENEKEYQEFKDLYKDRLGLSDTFSNNLIQQASQFSRSPSVVDAVLKQAYDQRLKQTAQSFAGRSGGGYLEDFRNTSDLGVNSIADQGVGQRLQEQQAKQQVLLNALNQAGGRAFSSSQSIPFSLLDRKQSLGKDSYGALFDYLNKKDNALATDRNFLNQLFAWKQGQQNASLNENQFGLQSESARRDATRADKADRRESRNVAWEKDKHGIDTVRKGAESGLEAIT